MTSAVLKLTLAEGHLEHRILLPPPPPLSAGLQVYAAVPSLGGAGGADPHAHWASTPLLSYSPGPQRLIF